MQNANRLFLSPELLKQLFDAKPIAAKVSELGALRNGTLHVTTVGADGATMSVLLYEAPNQNQLTPTPDSVSVPVTQEMLNKVSVKTVGPTYSADWREFADQIRKTKK